MVADLAGIGMKFPTVHFFPETIVSFARSVDTSSDETTIGDQIDELIMNSSLCLMKSVKHMK